MKPNTSIYNLPREEALSILRNRAEIEAQSAEHEGIYIEENKFYERFLLTYEKNMKTRREGGTL